MPATVSLGRAYERLDNAEEGTLARASQPPFGIGAIAAAAAVECGDQELIGRLFSGLSEPTATELVRETTRYLADCGRRTGRWRAYAEAPWLLPGGWGPGTLAWHARLDAHARTLPERPKPPKDERRSEIAKAAMRLIRAKRAVREIVDLVRAVNAAFDTPLQDQLVTETIVWAAQKIGREPDAA